MDIYTPELFISADDIERRVQSLASAITQDFFNQELIVICVLKGAFIFCSDLMKAIDLPVKLEFVQLSSYGDECVSVGDVKIKLDISGSIENANVLVVEDIIDTGLTMNFFLKLLKSKKPRQLKVASLLYKPGRQKHDIDIDYLAFEIEDKFVVGYGLDYAERYRELPYLGVLNVGH